MITLLAKLFIKNKNDIHLPKVRQAYGILCGSVGIGLNIVLFLIKFIAGTISGSIAITADAFNNLSDAGSSIMTLIGFAMAGKKPDLDHPYGHGRMEYISGIFVSIAILIMSFELVKSSIDKIIHPQDITFNYTVIIILILSIVVKLYMNFYNRRIAKKINSAAMMATATDSLSDTIATSVVLVSTLLTHFFHIRIDGYCGILVGLFVCYAGIRALKETIAPLLGLRPDEDYVNHIENIVMSHSAILGMHDLIVHDYGPGRVIISLHAEVPAKGNILELHDLIDNIEKDLQNELNCLATIHMDPIQNDDAATNESKQLILRILHEYNDDLTIHDYRIVKGPTHTNLIFDLVVPVNFKKTEAEIKEYINEEVHKEYPNYYCVISIDMKYTS